MSLQVKEDVGFEQRQWRVERIGWLLIAAIIVAALAGVFGPGPVSLSSITSEDGRLRVDYHRFARFGSRTRVNVEASGDLVDDGQLRLVVDEDWLSSVEVEHVTPMPSDVQPRGEDVLYTFAVAGRPDEVSVRFDLRPDAVGTVGGSVGTPDGISIEVGQFYYP